MGFFDIDEEHLQMIFDEAVRRSGGNISEAESDPEVEQAIHMSGLMMKHDAYDKLKSEWLYH